MERPYCVQRTSVILIGWLSSWDIKKGQRKIKHHLQKAVFLQLPVRVEKTDRRWVTWIKTKMGVLTKPNKSLDLYCKVQLIKIPTSNDKTTQEWKQFSILVCFSTWWNTISVIPHTLNSSFTYNWLKWSISKQGDRCNSLKDKGEARSVISFASLPNIQTQMNFVYSCALY